LKQIFIYDYIFFYIFITLNEFPFSPILISVILNNFILNKINIYILIDKYLYSYR